MNSTEGPKPPSTGSMSSNYIRVQAVPGVQTSKLLGVLRVSRVLNPVILRHPIKILGVLLQPGVPWSKNPEIRRVLLVPWNMTP